MYSNPAEYCITSAVGHSFNLCMSCRTFLQPVRGFAWAWRATCSECLLWLLANFRDFEPRERVPRTSARAQTRAVVFGRTPCVPRSREHEKRPAAGREKNADVQKKNTFIHRNSCVCLDACDYRAVISRMMNRHAHWVCAMSMRGTV